MPERTFRIIFPRRDNANSPIKREVLEDYARRVVNEFGGLTMWEGNGCWRAGTKKKPGPVMCDENFVLESVMNIDTTTGVTAWAQVDQATVFMRDLAHEIAVTLGQAATLTSVETDSRTEFVEPKDSWKESLPEEMLAERTEMLFRKLTE